MHHSIIQVPVKPKNIKLPTKSKQQRKVDHEAQQVVAEKTKQDNHSQRPKKKNSGKSMARRFFAKSGGDGDARDQALRAKEQKVQAKARS